MKKYLLEIIVFVCGAGVMIYELVGSRVLAPYVGTSIFVWSSLIGIILGSLSIGYWLGGIVSDRRPDFKILSMIILLAAIFVGFVTLSKDSVLNIIQGLSSNIKLNSILASLVLFAVPSVLLGMVSPFAVKLKIKNLNHSGKIVGNLYAISTVGSIVGTFLAGFVLIPLLGTTKILLILSITLFFASLLAMPKLRSIIKQKGNLMLIIVFLTIICSSQFFIKKTSIIDVDTQYNRVWIYNSIDDKSGDTIKVMQINKNYSAAMFIGNDEPVMQYLKFFRLAEHFNPGFRKSLLLGGAAYSYPKDYLKRYPKAKIDVVEIDPYLTHLAYQHFGLKKNPRMRIFHEDGRIYLNRTKNKYDVFFGDAFKSRSIPFQLSTLEAIKAIYNCLNEEGVAILNIFSALEEKKSEFLRAEYVTYSKVFPQVYLFPVENLTDESLYQNIILVALKSNEKPLFVSPVYELNNYLKHLWTKEINLDIPILTDDYSPVEYYIHKNI